MKGKFSSIWRVAIALMMVLSFSLVMAVPVSATHTSSATIDFQDGASTVTGTTEVILDVTVTNNGASDGNITAVEIDFTDSDFTVTDVGTLPASWAGDLDGSVVTYTPSDGGIAPGASVIFVPKVTNPAEAGAAAVPAVLTTDAGSQATLAAALNTGWITYEAPAGAGGNDITVAYVNPGQASQTLLVSVVVKAITVSLATDGGGALTSTAANVASAINGGTALVDATADSGHTAYVVQPLTVPAFTGGTSPDADKVCPLTPATLTITGVVPTITAVSPAAGNVGDTMWVELTGDDFTGTALTNASTTSLNFGTGITVVSTKFIGPTEIDCQITITASGTVRSVIATTAAGTGTEGSGFTPNAAGTAQVDVWEAYDLITDPFVTGSLDFRATTASIGAAITAATTDDILIAHAATYVEEVVINKSITLESLDGKATTIIDASTSGETGISITAAGVTVDGFTVAGNATGFGIVIGADGATIQNSTIDSAGTSILAGGGEIDGAQILDNLISNTGQGIWMGVGASNWLIEDNVIGGGLGEIDPAAIVMPGGGTGPTEDNTIKGNTISGNISTGIFFSLEGSTDIFDDIVIEGNTISDASNYGIQIPAGLTVTGVEITENDISGTWEDGINIQSWEESGGTSVINYNNLSGNGLYGSPTGGIKNKTGIAVDAKYNWWGEIGGPDAIISATWGPTAGTALGNGDRVSKDVTYDPWLTRVQATAVSDGIAYHGSTYPLEAGWNTLSVPLALDDGADTLTDIVALGDFFVTSGTDQNYLGGYYYDAVNTLWVPIPGTYEFAPCTAVYVKMKADASFPVLYSGVFSLPSLSLPAGWNLIGSAFGIDKAADADYGIAATGSTDGEKAVSIALASLGANASVVVSPSMPGQTAAWATVAIESDLMQVGEGYWVFMTAPATYAGFEVTPIYKIFLP